VTVKRDEIVQKLRAEQHSLRERFGVASLARFGSVARDEAGPDSDGDLLVEFARPITLFDLVAVQQYLERCLGVRHVDLVPRDSVYSAPREYILEGAVHVG
jgi:predicted nucleotidyltransferase